MNFNVEKLKTICEELQEHVQEMQLPSGEQKGIHR
jgi:hypothetical protein